MRDYGKLVMGELLVIRVSDYRVKLVRENR
jgi:hypothetical protein